MRILECLHSTTSTATKNGPFGPFAFLQSKFLPAHIIIVIIIITVLFCSKGVAFYHHVLILIILIIAPKIYFMYALRPGMPKQEINYFLRLLRCVLFVGRIWIMNVCHRHEHWEPCKWVKAPTCGCTYNSTNLSLAHSFNYRLRIHILISVSF